MLLILLACAPNAADSALPSDTASSWRDCAFAVPTGRPDEADAWYACVDAHVQGGGGCGPEGYLLGFGGKYARKYMLEVRPTLTAAGQAFLDANLVCLQAGLADAMDPDPRCADIETEGFASHVPCYVADGFCDLPLADVIAIAAAVEPDDQGRPEEIDAVAAIQEACAAR